MSTFEGNLNPSNDLKSVKYINTAFGFSKATYVFGFGGNNHDALVLEAKMNMMKNFPLENNQYYANYALDFKKKNMLIVQSAIVTVSADVVQDKENKNDDNYSDQLKSKLGIVDGNAYFSVGDTVIDALRNYYIIESNKGSNLIVNQLNTNQTRYSKLIKGPAEIFSTKIENIINLYPNNTFVQKDQIYLILGINSKSLLIQDLESLEIKVVDL